MEEYIAEVLPYEQLVKKVLAHEEILKNLPLDVMAHSAASDGTNNDAEA